MDFFPQLVGFFAWARNPDVPRRTDQAGVATTIRMHFHPARMKAIEVQYFLTLLLCIPRSGVQVHGKMEAGRARFMSCQSGPAPTTLCKTTLGPDGRRLAETKANHLPRQQRLAELLHAVVRACKNTSPRSRQLEPPEPRLGVVLELFFELLFEEWLRSTNESM